MNGGVDFGVEGARMTKAHACCTTLSRGDGATGRLAEACLCLRFGIGDDNEEDKEALKKLAGSKKKTEKKKEVVNKSMLVIEIKPNSSETSLDEIAAEVRKIQMEGLTWGESVKKVPIAFGLYKLQV